MTEYTDILTNENEPDTEIPDLAEEPTEESAEPAHVTGRRVSITSPEFEPVIYKIDDIIVRALRTAVDAHQGFTVTAKIQFTPIGSRFTVSHNVGYKFEPIKVEEKGGLYEDMLVELDADGNPIIPDGSAQQITLDEVAGATVTTDSSGVVQSVELDDTEPEPDPYPCTEECYLCDFGEYCDLREDGSSLIPYEDKHIIEAVENFNCPRRFPRRRYAELIKEADSDD